MGPPHAPYADRPNWDHLKLYTLNARGLNSPHKRARALRELRALGVSIAFFQETHFHAPQAPKFSNKHYPNGHFAHNPSTKSKGVAILFSANTQFHLEAEVRDTEGRYLFIKGKIGNSTLTFANLYLPNKGQKPFLASALRTLEEFGEGTIIIGGDFNAPLDPKMDTSKGASTIPGHILRGMRTLLSNHQFTDTWRILHHTDRDFTYYSAPHRSYSRIDYFFTQHRDLDTLLAAQIAPMTWSDHAPVIITIEHPKPLKPQWTWKLNESLLEDPLIQTDVRSALEHFFLTNKTPDSTPPTIWEAHKCVIRGILIKHGTRLKKQRTQEIAHLVTQVAQLEAKHKHTLHDATYKQLLETRAKLNSRLQSKIQFQFQLAKKTFYEFGNKSGKLLARALRARRKKCHVQKITAAGTHMLTPKAIADGFRQYYSSLYCLPLHTSRTNSTEATFIARQKEYIAQNLTSKLPPRA
ncbi:Hypothetical predicted protein, partial [Pelobates cultripes]